MKNSTNTHKLTQTAILAAIIIIMAFTPLGYLKIGVVSITFLTIPVVVGAIVLGPVGGAVLGGVFGLTSFFQCFGYDDFGTALLAINPVYTFIMCMIPRILIGLLAGLIFKGLQKVEKTGFLSYIITTVSGAAINTVLFVGALILFFGNSDYIRSFGDTTLDVLKLLITFNAGIEILVCGIVGAAIGKALAHILPKFAKK